MQERVEQAEQEQLELPMDYEGKQLSFQFSRTEKEQTQRK